MTRTERVRRAHRAALVSRVRREYRITEGRLQGQGTRAKPEIADYVLEYRNHKLAVVEAKRWDAALTEGLGQAKSYAAKLAVRYTYSTNGQGIYGIDMKTAAEGEVSAYPGPQELWDLTFGEHNAWRDRFPGFRSRTRAAPSVAVTTRTSLSIPF